MDRSRKANREGNEATLQHTSSLDASRVAELAEEKLVQLLTSIELLKQTPAGAAELRRRSKAFGECKRLDDEASTQFYDRLRHWLERGIPQTKRPLHPPRQNGP